VAISGHWKSVCFKRFYGIGTPFNNTGRPFGVTATVERKPIGRYIRGTFASLSINRWPKIHGNTTREIRVRTSEAKKHHQDQVTACHQNVSIDSDFFYVESYKMSDLSIKKKFYVSPSDSIASLSNALYLVLSR
jgi:hypothetical protein